MEQLCPFNQNYPCQEDICKIFNKEAGDCNINMIYTCLELLLEDSENVLKKLYDENGDV